jgi:hypothetical protein
MLHWNPNVSEENFAEHLVDALLRGAGPAPAPEPAVTEPAA